MMRYLLLSVLVVCMVGLIPLVTAAEPEPPTADEEFEEIRKIHLTLYVEPLPQPPKIEDFEKFNKLSPKALELFGTGSLNAFEPDFCAVLDSPYLTTEDRQIFLEFCKISLEWFKDMMRTTNNELDQGLVIAVTKVNAMDVSEEQKDEYISELKSDVETIRQMLFIDCCFQHIPRAENFLNEHKEVQTDKPIASFVDLEKDPSHYVKRYVTEPKYKDWFDKNYPDYTIWEAIGISIQQYQEIVDDLGGCPVAGTVLVNGVCQPVPTQSKTSFMPIEPLYIIIAVVAMGGIIGVIAVAKRGSKTPKPAQQKPAKKGKTSSACSNCGNTLKPTSKFCAKCGNQV